jgi:two-component system, OmpR family, response regulator CpxR
MNAHAGIIAVSALRVLVIDHDRFSYEMLDPKLNKSGIQATHVSTVVEGLIVKQCFLPHVILLEPHSPNNDPAAVVRLVSRDCGLIILSERADLADRIAGLELGADDYVRKPPQARELLARIRAVHRRLPRPPNEEIEIVIPEDINIGALKIDLCQQQVTLITGETVKLTSAEFIALKILVNADGKYVSREFLSESALKKPWRISDRSIDQIIYKIRLKIGGRLHHEYIRSVRGTGYTMPIYLRKLPSALQGVAQPERVDMAAV